MRFPMSFLPMLITMVVNALVALKRIEVFLLSSEADQHALPRAKHDKEKEGACTW